jgi:hypothetical protein
MESNQIASTTPVYTLSVTADLSGIPVHSIRQYIDKGLMIPFKKESSRNLFKHCWDQVYTGSYSLLGNQAMLQ